MTTQTLNRILSDEQLAELSLVQNYVRANYDYPDFSDPVDVVSIRLCAFEDELPDAQPGDWLIDDEAEGEVVRVIDNHVQSVWSSC